MDFTEEEIKTLLEALGKRYKSLRDQHELSGAGSNSKHHDPIRNLDRIIKRVLDYQAEHFPKEAVDETEQEPASDEAEDVSAETLKDYASFRLLLVDDDEADRDKLRSMLTEQGFQHIDESDDGHNAIATIKECAKPYDLVLCDVNMPTISGLDVVRLIRQDEKYASMPFVMVSKKGHKKSLEDALEVGVSGYIVKPLTVDKLMPKIDMLLH